MDQESISIVIPSYNGREILKKYLNSVIVACQKFSTSRTEIIIVDDASTDGTVEYLKLNFPQIKIIEHTNNQGFSTTANDGIFAAKNRIVVLLNSDVHVSEDFLKFLPEHFKDDDIFAVRPGLKSGINEGGDDLENPRIGGRFKLGFFEVAIKKNNGQCNAFFAGGGAAAFDKEKFKKLNGFDEIFSPFYFEDVDLSYRAWKRGWKILYEARSQAYHQSGATIGKTAKAFKIQTIAERNRYFLVWKNIIDPHLLFKHIIFIPLRIGVSILKGRTSAIIGFYYALKSLRKIKQKRKQEVRFQKISDNIIFSLFSE
jgi:GT2 family glycosyltransferase